MPRKTERQILLDLIVKEALDDIKTIERNSFGALSADDNSRIEKIFEECDEEIDSLFEERYMTPRTVVPKSNEWYAEILPEYSDTLFRHKLRVSREEFNNILQCIEGDIVFQQTMQMPISKQLAITLTRLGECGTSSSWKKTSMQFGVSEGIIGLATERTIKAILHQSHKYIVWPNADEREAICAEMAHELPKCVGYIDGTHIPLEEAPLEDHESYFSRKQRYGIQLQAIVDNNLIFRNINVGYPASVHDARVYRNSNFGKNPDQFLSAGQWIAGDSAYPLSVHLISPFRRSFAGLPPTHTKLFNKHISKHRVKVEHAFGILKEVFGSLKELRIRVSSSKGHTFACNWIHACIVLYNMIRPNIPYVPNCDDDDNGDDDQDDGECSNFDTHAQEGVGEEKRLSLVYWLLSKMYDK